MVYIRRYRRQTWVYLVECPDGYVYVGITDWLERRFKEHWYNPTSTLLVRHGGVARPCGFIGAVPLASRADGLQLERSLFRLWRGDRVRMLFAYGGLPWWVAVYVDRRLVYRSRDEWARFVLEV